MKLPDQLKDKLGNILVLIPAGEFLFGPQNLRIQINYHFYIDKFPVTNRDFWIFLEQTQYIPRSDPRTEFFREAAETKPNHPVVNLNWYEARAYASWAGKRLPTSKEWKKAARGDDGRLYPWGNQFSETKCNCLESGIGDTTPVDKYPEGVSPYGCYDMVGNVFKWVEDWASNPRFSSLPYSEKINRGGSYNRPKEHTNCIYIESDPPYYMMRDVGFRCAFSREIPPELQLEYIF